jgi:fibronectin-binding autotransporter adhesin
MKPKFRSLIAAFAPLSRSSLIVCASLCAATSAHADQTWTGATDAAWATLTNWSGGALPGTGENVVFDPTSTGNLTAIALGANRTVSGINFTSPAGPVTIATGSTLTLVNGIDMSAATQSLTIVAGVSLGSNVIPSTVQNWTVASGQTLATPVPARNSGANDLRVGGLLNVSGAGTTKLGAAASVVIPDGGGNPFVTLNNGNDWAAADATGTVIPAVYTAFPTAGALSGFTNWNVTGTGAYTMSSGGPASVRFDNSAGAVTVANTGTSTLRGIIMASGAQNVTINSNFIRPNRVSTAGATMSFIQNSTVGDFTLATNLGNASSGAPVALVKSGAGKMIVNAAQGYTGLTFIHGGVLQIGAGSTLGSLTSTNTIVNNASLIFDRSDALTANNNIIGTGSVTKNGAGILTLGGTSTFTGALNINGGSIAATALANLGGGTAVSMNNGGLVFLGAFDPTAKTVTIGSSGATFDTNGQNINFASAFATGSAGAVTKSGAGTLTLAADNDYSGGTTITGGTLRANAPTSSTGSGAVAVNNGGSLGGTGAVAGAVTVASGGNLSPGASVGTLTVGSLNLGAGSTATFEFTTGPDTNDQIAVANSNGLTINGGAITLLQENSLAPFTGPGGVTYSLISYSGTLTGSPTSLSVANPQSGFSYSFGASGGFVTLTINTTGIVRQWNAAAGGSWADDTKWTPTGAPNIAGATANFTTALDPLSSVTLDGNKTVGSVVFTSGTNGYTIAQGSGGSLILDNVSDPAGITNNDGNHEISAPITLTSNTSVSTAAADDSITLSGVITGGATLTAGGPGGLSLLGNNTLFSGAVTLNGGATTFANNGLGTGSLAVSGSLIWGSGNTQDISNRTITFGANPVTFNTNGNDVALVTGAIGNGGSAAFTKAGAGRLTLANTPTFTGAVTISGGVLQLGTGGTTGLVAGAINNNGELDINLVTGSALANLISGTGSLVHSGTGSLTLNADNTFNGATSITSPTGSLILTGALNLQSSTLFYATTGGTINFGALANVTLGGLSGDRNLVLENSTPAALPLTIGNNGQATTYSGILSGTGSLTKIGAGISTLGGANTYTGGTNASQGTLELGSGGSITGAGVTIATNGILQLNAGDAALTASGLCNLANNAGTAVLLVSDGTATLNGGVQALGNQNNGYRIELGGGSLGTPVMRLGRGSLNFGSEAAAIGSTTQGLYVNGGAVNISGALEMGVSSGANSSVSTFVASGSLSVGGKVTVGLNNGGRWSVLQVSGGTFDSTDTVDGVVLGGPAVGNALFAVSGGVSTVNRIQLGQANLAGTSLLRVSSGELYVGAGGITRGSTTNAPEVRLAGGILGAKTSWTCSLPINLSSNATIKAADAADLPNDITVDGLLSGAGSLIKEGTGTLTLAAGHTHTGDTEVKKGALSVVTRSFADASTIYIENTTGGATLNLNYSGGDRVAALSIDGSPVADGVYGSLTNPTLGITQTAAITGDGLLYVNVAVPLTPYDTWAQAAGLTPLNDGPTQDPDFDGIENSLEFVLGGNPLASSTGVLPLLVPDPSNFIFTFNRQDDSIGQVGLIFQYGSDLSGWTDIAIPEFSSGAVTVLPGSPADAISVSVPKGSNTLMFGRLKAVK